MHLEIKCLREALSQVSLNCYKIKIAAPGNPVSWKIAPSASGLWCLIYLIACRKRSRLDINNRRCLTAFERGWVMLLNIVIKKCVEGKPSSTWTRWNRISLSLSMWKKFSPGP